MLHKKQTKQFLHEQWKNVEENFKSFCTTADMEAVHDMRVVVKKIKAVVWLTDKCQKHTAMKKCMTLINNMYKQTGSIRDAQLSLQYCKKNAQAFAKLTEEQQRVIQTTFKSVSANQQQNLKQIKQTTKCMQGHCITISYKDANHLIEKRIQKIVTRFAASPWLKAEQLHECRKKIKTIINVHKIFLHHTNKPLLPHAKQWDKLQDCIGQWHDMMLFEALQKSMYSNEKEKHALEDSIKKLLNDIQLLAKKMVALHVGKKQMANAVGT